MWSPASAGSILHRPQQTIVGTVGRRHARMACQDQEALEVVALSLRGSVLVAYRDNAILGYHLRSYLSSGLYEGEYILVASETRSLLVARRRGEVRSLPHLWGEGHDWWRRLHQRVGEDGHGFRGAPCLDRSLRY